VYEVLINGVPSGVILVGTGAALNFTVPNGTFADGDILTVDAESGIAFCTLLMNGSVTINFDDPIVQNITTADPQVVCSTDDITLDIDGSEVGVIYEILVNGGVSGFTAAGTGAALSVTITAVNFVDGDVLTIQATSGTAACLVLMNGSVTVNFNDPAIQNITTADPQLICSVDDIILDLDGSEVGVTYEILVNGTGSGFTNAGTGAAISITIPAGNFVAGEVLTIQGDNGQCQTLMNGSVTVNFDDAAIQNITTADPLAVCTIDDAIIDLDGSEPGVTYEIFINAAPSGIILAGTGAPLTFTIPNGSFADLDIITIVGTSGLGCTTLMNNSVTISVNPNPVIQNITTPTPANVCSTDDLDIDLGSSEGGVSYEIFINGLPSGFSTIGTGLPITIVLPAGNFADTDIITVVGTNLAGCSSTMNNNVLVSLNPEPALQNITTADPQTVCDTDDVIIDLDNSEAGVNYELLNNGTNTGIIVAGTGAAISLTLPGGSYAAGDVITVEASNGICLVPMNGSVTINLTNPTVFNITNLSPVLICNAGDVFIDLDGSEAGINYEVLFNGVPTTNVLAGTGAPLQFTLLNGSFADSDIVTIEADGYTVIH